MDSGASITIISQKCLNKIEKSGMMTNNIKLDHGRFIVGVGGEKYKIDSKVRLNLKIGNTIFSYNFLVVPSVTRPIILGTDFLNYHGASLNFQQKEIYFPKNGVRVKLNSKSFDNAVFFEPSMMNVDVDSKTRI